MSAFIDGYALVEKDGQVGIIDNEGKLKEPLKYRLGIKNFRNEFIGLKIPLMIGLDLKNKKEEPIYFPFFVFGAEVDYIFEAVHYEDGENEKIGKFIDPWQSGVVIGGGVKRIMKQDQIALIGIYSRLGLSGFPAGQSNVFLPKLWPFQIGLSLGWRWKANLAFLSKKDKS